MLHLISSQFCPSKVKTQAAPLERKNQPQSSSYQKGLLNEEEI